MRKLEGIFVPNIVPYTEKNRIHEAELRRIVSWLIDKGVSGIYPNGSMGEFIRLSFEERKEVIRIIADEADGRVPILAGAAEANVEAVLEMCAYCAELGCRAVSITGPYYYQLSQDSIEAYFREIAAQSPIDIVVYNIPAFANEISIPILKRLAMDCPRIVGTKDSSKDMCRFLNLLNEIKPQRPDFSFLIGWEEIMVPALLMGADGGTLSSAGVVPEAIMKIYHETSNGNLNEAKRLQFKLLELFNTMVHGLNFPGGFRIGYEMRGFEPGPPRFPLSDHEKNYLNELRERIACMLEECGFAVTLSKKTASETPTQSSEVIQDIVSKVMDKLN